MDSEEAHSVVIRSPDETYSLFERIASPFQSLEDEHDYRLRRRPSVSWRWRLGFGILCAGSVAMYPAQLVQSVARSFPIAAATTLVLSLSAIVAIHWFTFNVAKYNYRKAVRIKFTCCCILIGCLQLWIIFAVLAHEPASRSYQAWAPWLTWNFRSLHFIILAPVLAFWFGEFYSVKLQSPVLGLDYFPIDPKHEATKIIESIKSNEHQENHNDDAIPRD